MVFFLLKKEKHFVPLPLLLFVYSVSPPILSRDLSFTLSLSLSCAHLNECAQCESYLVELSTFILALAAGGDVTSTMR